MVVSVMGVADMGVVVVDHFMTMPMGMPEGAISRCARDLIRAVHVVVMGIAVSAQWIVTVAVGMAECPVLMPMGMVVFEQNANA